MNHRGWHRNKAIGLKSLSNELALFYSANRERHLSSVLPLSYAQIRATEPGYPSLKAKAAQTRHLADFAVILANRHKLGDASRRPWRFPSSSPHAARSADHLGLLVPLFEGMARFHHACLLTPFPDAECKAALYMFLQSLKGLHELWRDGVPIEEQRSLPFVVRPKAHLLQHLVEDKLPLWGSPSLYWCYRDEDFVGFVKSMASKSKHPATIEARVGEKIRLHIGVTEALQRRQGSA